MLLAGRLPAALLKGRRDICTWGRYLFVCEGIVKLPRREYGGYSGLVGDENSVW